MVWKLASEEIKSILSRKSQQEITCGDKLYPENRAGSAQATSSALGQDMCFHEAFRPPYELFPGSPGSTWSHSLDQNLDIGARSTGQGQEEESIYQTYAIPGKKRSLQDQSLLETADCASVLTGLQPGGDQALLPGSKGQDKRKQAHVAPGEIEVGYQEKILHCKDGQALESPLLERFKSCVDVAPGDMI
ncbi:hypothetical protein DUI87_13297 [Hirundo rustica rustica]|uniref:Uncharacterized protein n=1 Tax=Hirundo rustica rustica TaxID=333673 RepID=A0A3M0KBH4_HIRRU|nr:hypothetical protein DUI87_13297 [Hirundo rustica rustica]